MLRSMKFLVLWRLDLSLVSEAVARMVGRMPAYGARLESQGKVLARYHLVGAHGGAWIYEASTAEELERLLVGAPVYNVATYTIHVLADMDEVSPS
jgi:muconolactone delta-isomerase